MRTLILDLLDLTKVESGKAKRDITKVDICQVVKTAIDTMQPYSIQRDVKVNLQCPGSLTMCADADELEIIFNNLISNAIKYNRDGGTVDCSILEENDQVSISVKDSGIGMTEQEMGKLFQDFVRIKNEKTKNITGSGLGLSIVKKLTENYGGKINVSSIPDQGSTFIVTLPNAKPCT
jgi:two-component system, sensor histidine kinase and response regulator